MPEFYLPQHVADILNRLAEKGHVAYLVGGCIRDAIMGRQVHDWDIATSAAPVDVATIFPKTIMTGEKFGTVTVLTDGDTVEVTTFRVEGEYRDNRRPESVEFVSNLNEDLSRRDFTMNAMAISVARNLIDPFDGIKDIENRIVRCVGNPNKRFSEDALRMFRALRFRAQLGFKIEEGTLAAIYANADRAKLISAERVCVELEKTLMSQRPEIAGEMIETGVLARYISTSKPGGTMSRLEKIKELPAEPTMRWCAFCAILQKEGLIKSAPEFLNNLHLSVKTVKICSHALSVSEFPDNRTDVKRLFIRYGTDATCCAAALFDILPKRQIIGSKMNDKQGNRHSDKFPAERQVDDSAASPESVEESSGRKEAFPCLTRVIEIISSGECFSLQKLVVSGNDLITLGYSPGQELGKRLNNLLDYVLEHPEDNTREVLLKIVKK